MSELVVDASIAGAWLLPDEASPAADEVLERIVGGDDLLCVPDLWTYEMVNLLLAAHRRARIAEADLTEAWLLLDAIPRRFYDQHSAQARQRISRMALRHHLSAYDAAYLELADRLQCPLRTGDARLAEAAGTMGLT